MKNNQPVSNIEIAFDTGINILSTTNLKGAITYINSDFIDISGFNEDELLDKNHNMVRHPDMPPAAFKNLWDTLKSGTPWMGIVKNRCKNGDHYWVDAFVSPITKDGKVVEYQSVRVKAEQSAIDRASSLYQKISEGKTINKSVGARLGLKYKLILANLLALSPAFFISEMSGMENYTGIGFLISAIMILLVNSIVAHPLNKLSKLAKGVFDNALMARIYSGRDDEFGQIELALKMKSSQLNAMVGRISDAGIKLNKTAEITESTAAQASDAVSEQQQQVIKVATAMTEMAATVQDIAANAATTLGHTNNAQEKADEGREVVDQTIKSINSMAREIENTSDTIQKLSQFSGNIESILGVIKSIAEQTNLLALNAAIEAARAGEQGRGFAVVADEVRTLAGRTQESTSEIETMIVQIVQGTNDSVDAMNLSRQKAEDCMDIAGKASTSLNSITEAVNNINDMAFQIASASEEQSIVAEEINNNVSAINVAAEHTSKGAKENAFVATDMKKIICSLNNLVKQFVNARA